MKRPRQSHSFGKTEAVAGGTKITNREGFNMGIDAVYGARFMPYAIHRIDDYDAIIILPKIQQRCTRCIHFGDHRIGKAWILSVRATTNPTASSCRYSLPMPMTRNRPSFFASRTFRSPLIYFQL